MDEREQFLWIGGWGVPPEWLLSRLESSLPSFTHRVLPPEPDWRERLANETYHHLGGYSLGAFLLLQHGGSIRAPVTLLAPFFGYPQEMGLGGKVRQVQLRYLARWLEREPLAALGDFYQRARLDLPAPANLPYSLPDLQWGLRQLAEQRVEPGLPRQWTALAGSEDPLVDARQLEKLAPGLRLVPGAGHEPSLLLRHLAKLLAAS